MESKVNEFDIDQLSLSAGVTVRTIRYYTQRGLLPSPGTGRGLRYNEGYLNRLKLIRKLQEQHLPLDEIKKRLETMTDGEVMETIDQSTTSSSAADYIGSVLNSYKRARPKEFAHDKTMDIAATYKSTLTSAKSSWERYKLAEEIELHVRSPATREQKRRIERIITAAERIMNE